MLSWVKWPMMELKELELSKQIAQEMWSGQNFYWKKIIKWVIVDATNDGGFLIRGIENVSGLGYIPLVIKLDLDGNIDNKYLGTNYPPNIGQHRIMDTKKLFKER